MMDLEHSAGDGDCMEREITTVKCFKTNLESVLLQVVQGRRGEKMLVRIHLLEYCG